MKDRRTLHPNGERIERRSTTAMLNERIVGLVYTQLMMRLMPGGWLGPRQLLVGSAAREGAK